MNQCALCQSIAHTELQAISKRSVCLGCATAIAAALPLLKTQPCRRQTICMRLQEYDINVMSTLQQVRDLVDWGISDEQIRGACDIAKKRNGTANFGYVYSILKNERERAVKKPEPAVEAPAESVKALEDWQRLGFTSQADYEKWQFAYDQESRRGNRITEAESRKRWLSEAI